MGALPSLVCSPGGFTFRRVVTFGLPLFFVIGPALFLCGLTVNNNVKLELCQPAELCSMLWQAAGHAELLVQWPAGADDSH